MDVGMILAVLGFYVIFAVLTAMLAYRCDHSDEACIISGFFWPLALIVFMFMGLWDKVEQLTLEREMPPLNEHPGRIISSHRRRHADPGDPEHWGSE